MYPSYNVVAGAVIQEGGSQFAEKVAATVKICMANFEGQQGYIDSWHELAKSGLLTVPSN